MHLLKICIKFLHLQQNCDSIQDSTKIIGLSSFCIFFWCILLFPYLKVKFWMWHSMKNDRVMFLSWMFVSWALQLSIKSKMHLSCFYKLISYSFNCLLKLSQLIYDFWLFEHSTDNSKFLRQWGFLDFRITKIFVLSDLSIFRQNNRVSLTLECLHSTGFSVQCKCVFW